jgi:hypothetical protein
MIGPMSVAQRAKSPRLQVPKLKNPTVQSSPKHAIMSDLDLIREVWRYFRDTFRFLSGSSTCPHTDLPAHYFC